MRDSNLSDYLNAFLKEDWKGFRVFAQAHVKSRSDLAILIDHIYKYNQNLNQPQLDTDYISKKLYKGKSRKTVLNLYSKATTLVKDYMIQDELSREDYFRQIFLLKAYNRRLLYNKADKLHEQTSERLKKEKIDLWPALYQQLMDHHFYFSNNPKTAKKKLHLTLQSAINSMADYHDQMRALYNFEIQNNISINKKGFDEIVDDYNFSTEHTSEFVKIFRLLKDIRTDPREADVNIVQHYLFEKHSELSEVIILILYLMLRMHFARLANQGDLTMARKIFILHRFIIDNNYFLYEGQLALNTYMQVAELAAFLKEHKWGDRYINKYIAYLPSENRGIIESLSRAYMHYSRNDYQHALDVLNRVYPKNVLLKSMLNRLQLIIFIDFDPNNHYFLLQKIENYRLFIYRNKNSFSNRVYTASINLSKLLKMIVEKKDVNKVESTFKSFHLVFYRYYLWRKIEAIKMTQS